jgi:hypothetical protein
MIGANRRRLENCKVTSERPVAVRLLRDSRFCCPVSLPQAQNFPKSVFVVLSRIFRSALGRVALAVVPQTLAASPIAVLATTLETFHSR